MHLKNKIIISSEFHCSLSYVVILFHNRGGTRVSVISYRISNCMSGGQFQHKYEDAIMRTIDLAEYHEISLTKSHQ